MAAISRANELHQLLPGLNALFGEEYNNYENEHEEIYATENSERSFEEATEALVAKIQEEHLDHHVSAMQAACSASTEGNWHYCMQHLC